MALIASIPPQAFAQTSGSTSARSAQSPGAAPVDASLATPAGHEVNVGVGGYSDGIGGIGGTGFSPIVNHPEVAILGLSRSRMEPEWVNNKFEPRLILPLSLSYDHRLIDGADAARFLRWIAEAFEQPFLLSVQG